MLLNLRFEYFYLLNFFFKFIQNFLNKVLTLNFLLNNRSMNFLHIIKTFQNFFTMKIQIIFHLLILYEILSLLVGNYCYEKSLNYLRILIFQLTLQLWRNGNNIKIIRTWFKYYQIHKIKYSHIKIWKITHKQLRSLFIKLSMNNFWYIFLSNFFDHLLKIWLYFFLIFIIGIYRK